MRLIKGILILSVLACSSLLTTAKEMTIQRLVVPHNIYMMQNTRLIRPDKDCCRKQLVKNEKLQNCSFAKSMTIENDSLLQTYCFQLPSISKLSSLNMHYCNIDSLLKCNLITNRK